MARFTIYIYGTSYMMGEIPPACSVSLKLASRNQRAMSTSPHSPTVPQLQFETGGIRHTSCMDKPMGPIDRQLFLWVSNTELGCQISHFSSCASIATSHASHVKKSNSDFGYIAE